ncbi:MULTISPECIES: hypothetical protein [unclassified Shewanella]|uniref:hypothetical protein n=1 Tax=unclassified Shewanella TaxID=196818 RepID=UPI0035544C92
MKFNTEDLCYMDPEILEKGSCELYVIATELRAEHPKAASLLYNIITYINGDFVILSPQIIKKTLLSLSPSEGSEELYQTDQNLIEEKNNKLYEICDELTAKYPQAASILYDIVFFLFGDSRSTPEIIKEKLISFSLGESNSQLCERYNRMQNNIKE